MTLTVLKISYLERLNIKIFAWLSTLFSRLKIEPLIKQIGIKSAKIDLAPLMCRPRRLDLVQISCSF